MDKPRASRPRVVVIGGGFAGINATHALRDADVDVTLVDRNNYHTFQPLLYQVGTGYLSPEEVGAALRAVFRRQRNVTTRVAAVTGIDWSTRMVRLDRGGPRPFDYLILTAGAESNFFGIPGMEETSWPLYTLPDAIALRAHLLRILDAEPHTRQATVLVVGGGPTGVETASALASMAREIVGPQFDLSVVLAEMADRLLAGFHPDSSKRALADLRRRGVDVRLGATVRSADERGVTLADGSQITASTVIWAAGVHANSLAQALGVRTAKQRRIVVDECLRIPSHDGVFAAGDIAAVPSSHSKPDDAPLPMLASVAIQTGKHAGEQVQRLLHGQPCVPFRFKDKGMMAVLGRGDAVAEIPIAPGATSGRVPRLRFGGRVAWLLWLGVHIVYLIGFRNRIKVLVDWAWNYFTSRGAGAILLSDQAAAQRPRSA